MCFTTVSIVGSFVPRNKLRKRTYFAQNVYTTRIHVPDQRRMLRTIQHWAVCNKGLRSQWMLIHLTFTKRIIAYTMKNVKPAGGRHILPHNITAIVKVVRIHQPAWTSGSRLHGSGTRTVHATGGTNIWSFHGRTNVLMSPAMTSIQTEISETSVSM
jgi:hypothetical protein